MKFNCLCPLIGKFGKTPHIFFFIETKLTYKIRLKISYFFAFPTKTKHNYKYMKDKAIALPYSVFFLGKSIAASW